jgi:phosphoribosylaminoimidazolecarboxamide formyltransferase/IMP cyclohydrolase
MLIASGGTAQTLKAGKLNPMLVKDFTGFPEILGGRVKTIHPKIAGGILADRTSEDQMIEAEKFGIPPIDIVCVNFYKFMRAVEAAQRGELIYAQVVEKIDVGGPGLVAAAVKNHASVLAVTDPTQYPEVLKQLELPGGPSFTFKKALAEAAANRIGSFYTNVWRGLREFEVSADGKVIHKLVT